MNLLIDESIGRPIVERLRHDGHTLTLAEEVAADRPDTEILALAQRLGAVVLTEDTDFGELVMHQHLPSAGVILVRLSGMARAAQPEYVAQALAPHETALPGRFTVLMPSSIRIRPLP